MILILIGFLLAGCAEVGTVSKGNVQDGSNKTCIVSPTVAPEVLLKPVTPNIKFNAKQQKYLNDALPPKVREVLEKAETFEILAEIRRENESDGEGMTFEPNRIARISDDKDKKEILEDFYFDASNEDSPAACYEPHHGIRATYQGKTVEIEICFSCSRFIVKSEFGEFDGTIVREKRKSEDLFNRIVETKSVWLK